MKKQIKSVSLLQNAKMVAALYLFLSLPILAVVAAIGGATSRPDLSLVAILMFVAAYVASGFVFALIGGWVYNLVAGVVGGFEFTTSEVSKG
jgi:hypothetical protein